MRPERIRCYFRPALEVEADGRRDCARRDVVRSAERRKEIVERLFVRQIDHRHAGAPFVSFAMETVVMAHGDVEQVARLDALRIVIVILLARSWTCTYMDPRRAARGKRRSQRVWSGKFAIALRPA
jgi:hypothetical protein